MSDIECVWPAEAILGEAPHWCADQAVLLWVDIDGHKVFRFDPASGQNAVYEQNHEIGCIVPRVGGGFVAGTDAGLAYLDADLSRIDIFADPESDVTGTRFNDGKCDARGRLWVASADRNETDPIAALYRLNGSGDLVRILPDVIVGNGMGWSPDQHTMYFTDTSRGAIYAFDYDIETGTPENQRIFVEVPDGNGYPDGLTVDTEGFVWSAHWNGWRVTRYDPDGRIDRVLKLPVPNVTSLAFGGPNLDQLYVTTARLWLSDEELANAPLSGGLFVADVGVSGMMATSYTG